MITLTLAALVKFTALPVLAAFLLFLATQTLRTSDAGSFLVRTRMVAGKLLLAGVISLLLALALYLPFWQGHIFPDILSSFKNAPSSNYAENSFLRSVIWFLKYHSEYYANPLIMFFTVRQFWDIFTMVMVVLCLLAGAFLLYRKPETRTFIGVALATMGAMLLFTPWFFSWYITWIVGLPIRQSRFASAQFAYTLIFSFSAFITYVFNSGYLDAQSWLASPLDTFFPICAFLLTLIFWKHPSTTGVNNS
jgi:hypothetical protein